MHKFVKCLFINFVGVYKTMQNIFAHLVSSKKNVKNLLHINSGSYMQVHSFKKACVAVYPCTVQNDIVWFWPNSDPQYSDILSKKRPPNIPELDDPSFTKSMMNRDIPYGYVCLTPQCPHFLLLITSKLRDHNLSADIHCECICVCV